MTYDKEYYVKNKEKISKRATEWRKNNPDRVKKILAKSRRKDPVRKLLNNARARAKAKGLEFNLEHVDVVIPEKCPLLDIVLSVDGAADYSPSLDRIDNSKGYVKGNVWIISFKANRMKNTATLQELESFCSNYLKLKDIISYD